MNFKFKPILNLSFMGWLTVALASYYFVRNPLTPLLVAREWLPLGSSVGVVVEAAVNLMCAVWLYGVAFSLGRPLVKRLARLTGLETVLFAIPIGWGIIGLPLLALGLLGLLTTPILSGYALIISMPLAYQLIYQRPKLDGVMAHCRQHRWATLYFSLTLMIGLGLTLLPPTSWDGLFYHLTGPKLYLEAGGIYPGRDIPHLSFPSLYSIVFMLVMAVRGDIVPQLLHFGNYFLIIGLVYGTARRHLGVTNGWLAGLAVATLPMLLTLASWAYNDLALAFYANGAFYAYLCYREEGVGAEGRGWLIISGLCAGLAMSLKYTSFIAPLTIGLYILWQHRREPMVAMRQAFIFSAPAILIALPWYLKNMAFMGNPFYPFVFGGPFWNEFRAVGYAAAGTGLGQNPLSLLLLPLTITLGYDFVNGMQDASADGLTGPLFLLLLPPLLYLVSRYRRRPHPEYGAVVPLALFALAQTVVWTAGAFNSGALFQTRLMLAAFVTLAPLVALLYERLPRYDVTIQRIVQVAWGFILVMTLVHHVGECFVYQPWAYLSGGETREAYLQRRLPGHYRMMQYIDEALVDEATVLMLWEPRSYYCERDCRPDSILDSFGNFIYLYEDAEGIVGAWEEMGVSHVLIFQAGFDHLDSQEALAYDAVSLNRQLLDQLKADYLEQVTTTPGYELYEVRDE
ncbi:MAG TPA: glycosyltransferase family 39 protein [Anaerolineae bacterium]|nr:glycosyltransferase family 39 protein [Anaerolineae bacterium]